jgi:phage anti-repressor protein
MNGNNNNRPVQSLNELPIIQQGENLLVSANYLHKRLNVPTKFSMWIQRRINEYGFEPRIDYFDFPNLGIKSDGLLPKFGKQKTGSGGHNAKDYLLTLDTAKELAMLECNEVGRQIRRYFISIEKRYRDWIGFILPRLEMDYDLFGQREGYNYLQLLKACGCSTHSGARSARQRKNPQEFWRNGRGELIVSGKYGKAIITNTIARKLNIETKQRRLAALPQGGAQ